MSAAFDILEEVSSKFTGTVVLYEGKAVLVKGCQQGLNPGQFMLSLAMQNAKNLKSVDVEDPKIDYKNYQIGYCNGGKFASWWYRKPHKQWQQGLKSNQMGWKVSIPGVHAHGNFGFNKPFINMLEGVYPHVEDVKKLLMDHAVVAMAFHKDFGLSFDELHDDFVLEYHGVKIGSSVDRDLKQFKIIAEARHLLEALQEARSVQA